MIKTFEQFINEGVSVQPEMVDLGLSVKWASFNLGAQSPEEYGDYFTNEHYDSEHDTATQILGGNWRMPTKEEWEELINNTTVSGDEKLNGIWGTKFTAENGNWIFLPSSGCRYESNLYGVGNYGLYWSSSKYNKKPFHSWYLDCEGNEVVVQGYSNNNGISIRPVSD